MEMRKTIVPRVPDPHGTVQRFWMERGHKANWSKWEKSFADSTSMALVNIIARKRQKSGYLHSDDFGAFFLTEKRYTEVKP